MKCINYLKRFLRASWKFYWKWCLWA